MRYKQINLALLLALLALPVYGGSPAAGTGGGTGDAGIPVGTPSAGPQPCLTQPVHVYDMVQWMVQAYLNHENSYLQAHDGSSTLSIFTTPVGSRFYRISGFNDRAGSSGNEVYDFDANYIYIRRETRFSSASDFNYHPSYTWAPRYAVTLASDGRACSNMQVDGHYDSYTNCVKGPRLGSTFLIAVSGPYTVAIGGDIGTVAALRLSSTNLSSFATEEYWYAMPWGMVMYKLLDSNHNLVRQEIYDTIFPNQPPLVLQCGIGY